MSLLFDNPRDKETMHMIRAGKLKNIEGKRIGDLRGDFRGTYLPVIFIAETLQEKIRTKFKKYKNIEVNEYYVYLKEDSVVRIIVEFFTLYPKFMNRIPVEKEWRWVWAGEFYFKVGESLKEYTSKPRDYRHENPHGIGSYRRVFPLFNHAERELKKILKSKVTIENIREIGKK